MSNDNTIKLINKNESAPKEFYIFLDFGDNIYDYVNQHNYCLSGVMISAALKRYLGEGNLTNYENGEIDYLPFVRTDMPNMFIPSAFILKTINEYNLEHNLEWYRRNNLKKYPSRFSSIFAFGDYESCKEVSKRHGWNLSSVKKFRLYEGLGELKKYVRIGKFNMEIISMLRGTPVMCFPIEDQEELYKKYWTGEGNTIIDFMGERIESGGIYEYLIEGMLEEVKD